MRSALAAALLLAAAPAPAAEAPPTLEWLVGSWRGSGERGGRPTRAELDVRPALGGRFLELTYRSEGFEGRAFYRRVAGGRWRGEWFDNRGVHFGIDAEAAERRLVADWSGSERGRTVYRLDADGSLELVDSVAARDGTLREFARHRLARTD